MDPGTILAIVSLALQVVKLADSVIDTFDRIQNAPRELRDFRQAVVRLQRHLEFLKADTSSFPPGELLHDDDIHEIEETLMLCKVLLQQHIDGQKKNPLVTSVVRGVWTFRNNQRLVKYKTRIDAHYIQILVPSWLRSLSARNAPYHHLPPNEHEDSILETEPDNDSTLNTLQNPSSSQYLVAPEHLQNITQKLEKLKIADDKEATEQTLRSIDYELRTCWTELGLVDEDDNDLVEYSFPTMKRRSTLSYEDAPTTLQLETAPKQHRRLHLRRLHIMARDDESRILQYQNDDCTIHVTHVGTAARISQDKTVGSSKKVSFLKQHLVTVVDREGYHIYRLDPKYKFEDREACERFQSTLREREIQGAFEAVEIKLNDRIVARRQMIRFWHRTERNGTVTNTITFYVSSGPSAGEHEEINLADLQSVVTYPRSRRLSDFGRRIESKSLDILPSQLGVRHLHIKFETDEEARHFESRFGAMQNGDFSQPPSLRGGWSTTTESTSAPTPVMVPSSSTVPVIALDLDSQEEFYREWSTVIFKDYMGLATPSTIDDQQAKIRWNRANQLGSLANHYPILATYSTVYDETSTPISKLSCYREDGSLVPDFGYPEGNTLSSISPRIMGIDTINGPDSSACGSCWMIEYENESRPYLAVDGAKSGIALSLEGMNSLTGGKAEELGTIEVKAKRVSLLNCGLYNP
ncbi:hypothetical protein FSARC_5172 [Fusarium sarcochroum]|uniref:Fungal N-terminal domain-containing protein n=1 Tax=Fusarium sarcochroum TaxID=1208366 RepID=A0A8H4U000_9HYPO|nr:hypothetical protein FSARC_5172 [Fusarium sarcochroum]